MRIARTIAEVMRVPEGHGFVPTMGALHAGHRSLLDLARRECAFVTLSVFVNPLQFGPGEDLSRYPRPIERDLAMAEAAGVDQAFLPSVEEMYPDGPPMVRITAGPLGEKWEGASRPGHFDGALTVVAKLLHLGIPGTGLPGGRAFIAGSGGGLPAYRAYFGQKDAQQVLVVRRVVRDLDLDVRVALSLVLVDPRPVVADDAQRDALDRPVVLRARDGRGAHDHSDPSLSGRTMAIS